MVPAQLEFTRETQRHIGNGKQKKIYPVFPRALRVKGFDPMPTVKLKIDVSGTMATKPGANSTNSIKSRAPLSAPNSAAAD